MEFDEKTLESNFNIEYVNEPNFHIVCQKNGNTYVTCYSVRVLPFSNFEKLLNNKGINKIYILKDINGDILHEFKNSGGGYSYYIRAYIDFKNKRFKLKKL